MWGVGGIVFVVQSRNSCDSGTHTHREGALSFIYYDYYNCTTTSYYKYAAAAGAA
jgi:hypothetical protein